MALEFVGRFRLTDDTLDRHSQRLIPTGAKLKNFKSNAVMFYNHMRVRRWSESIKTGEAPLPIGLWQNIKMDKSGVYADAWVEMDKELDPAAFAIGHKILNGTLKTCSVGIRWLKFSDDDKDKVVGQKGLTILSYEVLEASITDIPSNTNAVKIDSEKVKNASASELEDIDTDFIASGSIIIKNENMNFFEKFLAQFNKSTGAELTEKSSQAEIDAAMAKAFGDVSDSKASGIKEIIKSMNTSFGSKIDALEKSLADQKEGYEKLISDLKGEVTTEINLIKGASTAGGEGEDEDTQFNKGAGGEGEDGKAGVIDTAELEKAFDQYDI